jgi:Arc/MetJ-type ribon-helix-helix transcriptional regulator
MVEKADRPLARVTTTINLPRNLVEQIDDFRFERRLSSRTEAIRQLMKRHSRTSKKPNAAAPHGDAKTLASRQGACYTRWPGHCWRQRHPGHAHRAFVWEEGRNPNAGHARTLDEAIIAASPECSDSGYDR